MTSRTGGRSLEQVAERATGVSVGLEGVLPPGGHAEDLPAAWTNGSAIVCGRSSSSSGNGVRPTYRELRRRGRTGGVGETGRSVHGKLVADRGTHSPAHGLAR